MKSCPEVEIERAFNCLVRLVRLAHLLYAVTLAFDFTRCHQYLHSNSSRVYKIGEYAIYIFRRQIHVIDRLICLDWLRLACPELSFCRKATGRYRIE